MKKTILFLLILTMLVSCFASCGDEQGNQPNPYPNGQATNDQQATEPPVITDEFGRPVLETSLPELDYNNESVNIMIRTANQRHFLGDESVQATLLEQALFTRNEIVQDTLNVHLNYIPIEQTGSDTTFYDTTVQQAMSGAGEYDIVTSYAYYTPALGVAGCFANMNNVPMLDMNAICWNTTFAESVAYDGALYFNVGDFSLDYIRQLTCIFFNKQLAETHFGDANVFYDMVNDGSWTIENATAMLKDIYTDVNQNSISDEGDVYGFYVGATSGPCEALATCIGFNYTYKDSNGDYQIFEMDSALSDKIDAIHTFVAQEFCAPRSIWNWKKGRTAFIEQKALMVLQCFDVADAYVDVDFDYGFLPIFKYDEAQQDYYTGVGDSFSLQCIMVNTKDLSRTGAVLQCLNEVSYRKLTPEYFDILLKGRYADAPEDVEMLELLRRTATLDFGRIYSVCLSRITGNVWNNFTDTARDYSSWYSQNIGTYQENLRVLLEDLKVKEGQ
ncbi:MAG: hypothetical protein E7620_03220 [Ruminococcaceae bacterium]|nr:hypothetical protein [Oscillospiraceae bacterium]